MNSLLLLYIVVSKEYAPDNRNMLLCILTYSLTSTMSYCVIHRPESLDGSHASSNTAEMSSSWTCTAPPAQAQAQTTKQ